MKGMKLMDTVKTFVKYIIWIILFWIISDFLINVGLKTTYNEMQKIGQIPSGIQVKEIKSTAVNGKINLIVNSTSLSGKFIKVDLYSSKDNLLGTQYLDIGEIKENQTKEIDKYFKISDVKKYEIFVTDEKGESSEGFMDTAMSTLTILLTAIKIMIVF